MAGNTRPKGEDSSRTGPSGVTGEIIKVAGEQAVDWLTSICNRIVKEEAIPESWQME